VRPTRPKARTVCVLPAFTPAAALLVAVFVALPAVFVAVSTARALASIALDVASRVFSQARSMRPDSDASGIASESPAATIGPRANVDSTLGGVASRMARMSGVAAGFRPGAPERESRVFATFARSATSRAPGAEAGVGVGALGVTGAPLVTRASSEPSPCANGIDATTADDGAGDAEGALTAGGVAVAVGIAPEAAEAARRASVSRDSGEKRGNETSIGSIDAEAIRKS
jgi:hypothetical protein